MFKSLIGWQLVDLNDETLTVRNPHNGEVRHYDFDLDQGDCCGYAELYSQLFISEDEQARNPIITKVEEEFNNDGYSETLSVVFFGEVKKMATIEAEASSGSGWSYGASVCVKLRGTDEEKIAVEW